MTIKILDQDTRKQVYETHMKQDFPPAELKPLASIERMIEAGIYICTGLYDESDTMLAYAFFVVSKAANCLLLDYLAVCDGGRGKGYGGIYLETMKDYFAGQDGIFIECESVASATTKEKEEIRSSRIRFYQHHGALMTESMSNLFDVEYSILYLPVGRELSQAECYDRIQGIYRVMFPEKHRNRVRLWRQ